jgi:transcription elongation factor GreA
MAHEILLTTKGHEKLRRELEELKGPIRQSVAEAIREAKSHGDLKENAAYHEAKLNQNRLEGRIADLEKVLQLAKIVDRPEATDGEAHLGSIIVLKDLVWGDELKVTLVGSYEADPANDMISITSPLGASLIGRTVGDIIEVEAPAGKLKYSVLHIHLELSTG